MTSTALTLGAWGILVHVWSVLLFLQHRMRRDGSLVSIAVPADEAAAASVCVIVPAKDEEAGIAGCLASVLEQDLAGMTVVVADDRSTDGTAAAVEAIDDPRVELLRVHELPDGWLGKSHALHLATASRRAGWFLFLDADARLLDPRCVRAAVGEAERRGVDLFTLLPAQRLGGFWEGMLIPLCSGVMALWYGSSNRKRAKGFANGQFLLVRRSAYEAVGGHASVRRAIIEDVPLAERFRAAGFRTRAGGGAELVSVRMYDSGAAVFRGWSRIFVGALRSRWKLLASVGWLLFGNLLPFAAAPFLVAGWFRLAGEVGWGAAPAAAPDLVALSLVCLSHLVLLIVVSRGFWALGRCDRRYLWLYPLSVLGVVAILFHALWVLAVRRRLGWRNTGYRFDRRGLILTGDA